MESNVIIYRWNNMEICRVNNPPIIPNLKEIVLLDTYPATNSLNSELTTGKKWLVVDKLHWNGGVTIEVIIT